MRGLTFDDAATYPIWVQGCVGTQWADYLGSMEITMDDERHPPVTTLHGRMTDQSSLMGIINGLYDLGFTLLSVEHQPSP